MQWIEDTYKVKRGNVSLKVSKNEVNKYFDMGYDIYSLDGKLLKRAVPKDVPTLQKAFLDSEKRIAKLEAEIASLKEQLNKKATTRKTTKKTDEE